MVTQPFHVPYVVSDMDVLTFDLSTISLIMLWVCFVTISSPCSVCMTETWHDTDSPVFGRCRASGYSVVDHPRLRTRDDLSVNHGGVALLAAPGTSVCHGADWTWTCFSRGLLCPFYVNHPLGRLKPTRLRLCIINNVISGIDDDIRPTLLIVRRPQPSDPWFDAWLPSAPLAAWSGLFWQLFIKPPL